MTDSHPTETLSVLRHLAPQAMRGQIRQESRARQRHLPPISVYRWWARRTETVTGAIIDALDDDTSGRMLIADTFAGGGVIALAALLRGHQVYAQDVNPWAARSLATMLGLPSAADLSAAGDRLHRSTSDLLLEAYGTTMADGTPAKITHTMRVATAECPGCARTIRLFPTGLASLHTRVDCGGDSGYVACPAGHLTRSAADRRTTCGSCGRYVKPSARYTPNRVARCVDCRWTGKLCDLAGADGFRWEVALVERVSEGRREISPPSDAERAQADDVRWHPTRGLPRIDPGVETSVLLRHGMTHWHHLYPNRQRVVIEALQSACVEAGEGDRRVTGALEAAVIGSTEMAGLVSRWDPRYLKPYEAVANHRFSFTTLAAEPNVWGAHGSGRGTVNRRLEHFAKASIWLDEKVGRRLNVIGPKQAWGTPGAMPDDADALIVSGSSGRLHLPDNSVSGIATDPPYHDDVHYAELSDLFRAWGGHTTGALDGDAIVRPMAGAVAGTDAYEALLTEVFAEMNRVLKPGGHVVLSYANRHPAAWVALYDALQAAGFEAVGYTVVHSENETDHAKVGRRACTLDLLIDLIVKDGQPVRSFEPGHSPLNEEERYCRLIGAWALRIGNLPPGWSESFIAEAKRAAFVSPL